jgi:hypothetical protein
MSGPRGIALALDLARMPALALSKQNTPLPSDIFEIMRIATGSPDICQSASEVTGQSPRVLVEAARFYLQQTLLRPDADSYRVLGLPPGASRELARRHMRCLLQWLHPDVNREWDSVYAERVLKAWREVSANFDSSSRSYVPAGPESQAPVNSAPARTPWIVKSRKKTKVQPGHALIRVAKRVGFEVAAVALLGAVVIAVYAIQ